MAVSKKMLSSFVLVYWKLSGTATAGQFGYRLQNPWQALKKYMTGSRGGSSMFFTDNGAEPKLIDASGSVWRVEISQVPLLSGISIETFSRLLFEKLIAQITVPQGGDLMRLIYFHESAQGEFEWTCCATTRSPIG